MSETLMGMAADAAREEMQPRDDRGNVITKAELDAALQQSNESAAHFYGTNEPVTAASVCIHCGQECGEQCEPAPPVTAARVISKEDIMARLLALPAEIAAREGELIRAEDDVSTAKAALVAREDELLIGGAHLIDGRNAETRAAQMRQATSRERCGLADVEDYARRMRMTYHRSVNEFSSLKAVARLLAG